MRQEISEGVGRGDPGSGMPPILLSDATIRDVPALVAIDAVSSRTPWSRRLFADEIESAVSRVLVARCQGGGSEVVGFICWSAIADELEIRNLAVHPDARRRGVGRELVRTVLERARADGAEAAHLEVRAANRAARALYASLGFETAGTRPSYYARGDQSRGDQSRGDQSRGDDAIRMRLRLS